jgi:hypothetical protein
MISSLLSVIVLGVAAAAALALYLLPVLIGWARHVPDLGAVAVLNVVLGWTFVFWVVALAMALRSAAPRSGALVQVFQNPPPPPPPALHGPLWAGPAGPRDPRAAPPLPLPPVPPGSGPA